MIIAVDFDGTLCGNAWPGIGEPNTELIRQLAERQKGGDSIILWTMRTDELLNAAVEWSAEQGLLFDAVNDNLPSEKKRWGNNPRKVYADIYIDDHNVKPADFISRKMSRLKHIRQKFTRAQKDGNG